MDCLLVLLGNGNGHLRAMGVVIDADVLDVGQVVKVDEEHLAHERRRVVVEVFMVEVVEGLY